MIVMIIIKKNNLYALFVLLLCGFSISCENKIENHNLSTPIEGITDYEGFSSVSDTFVMDTMIFLSVYDKKNYELKKMMLCDLNFTQGEGNLYGFSFNENLKNLIISNNSNSYLSWSVNFDSKGNLSSINLLREKESPGFSIEYRFSERTLNKVIIDDTIVKEFNIKSDFTPFFFDSINKKYLDEDKIIDNFPWYFISGFYLDF